MHTVDRIEANIRRASQQGPSYLFLNVKSQLTYLRLQILALVVLLSHLLSKNPGLSNTIWAKSPCRVDHLTKYTWIPPLGLLLPTLHLRSKFLDFAQRSVQHGQKFFDLGLKAR